MSKYRIELPTSWTADQAWAMLELIDIVNGAVWNAYETKLLSQPRRRAPPLCDKNGNPPPKQSYENDLPF